MDLSGFTLFELYVLYYTLGLEILKRIWFVPVILILIFGALTLRVLLKK
jgi:hypothetical protein